MSYSPERNKEYLKERYEKQRADMIRILGGRCVVCGSADNLEIDHIEPSAKSFPVSKLWSKKDFNSIVMEELKKCQLLCHEHHLGKTIEHSKSTVRRSEHGTLSRYQRYKCRCDLCCEAQRMYKRKRRAEAGDYSSRGPYNLTAEHGTPRSYSRGCKCDLCKAAHANQARIRRNKMGA